MAYVTYTGPHPEPSFAFPDYGGPTGPTREYLGYEPTGQVTPMLLGSAAIRNETVAFPTGLRRRCGTWSALILLAIVKTSDSPFWKPWTIRLERGERAMVRRRAPWLKTPAAALTLITKEHLEGALAVEWKRYNDYVPPPRKRPWSDQLK